MTGVRRAAVAGSWYPGTRAALERAVDAHLATALAADESFPRAIVAPHAGLMYSGPVAAHAYQLVRACTYDAVVLVGPSHYVGFEGVSIWPSGSWETPLGPIAVDATLADAIISASPSIHAHPAAHAREHSLEMQMPFLARVLPGVPIVPLVMGYQTRETAERLGDTLAHVLQEAAHADRRTRALLIASSDLSHFNDARTAGAMDSVILRHVESLDPESLMDSLEREPSHACGGGPMVAVLMAVRQLGASRARVLRYAHSGDVSGDKSSVVGYMAAAVW